MKIQVTCPECGEHPPITTEMTVHTSSDAHGPHLSFMHDDGSIVRLMPNRTEIDLLHFFSHEVLKGSKSCG